MATWGQQRSKADKCSLISHLNVDAVSGGHPVERFLAALRHLRRGRAGAVLVNKALHLLLLLHACCVIPVLLQVAFHQLPLEAVVVALKPLDVLVCQVQHVGAYVVQKVSRVRNHDERLLPLAEVVLKPDHRWQIQVVGRLVE